jgi:hypothetical protein
LSVDADNAAVLKDHAALTDILEVLWRNNGHVSDPGSAGRWGGSGISKGQDGEKRHQHNDEYFHPIFSYPRKQASARELAPFWGRPQQHNSTS